MHCHTMSWKGRLPVNCISGRPFVNNPVRSRDGVSGRESSGAAPVGRGPAVHARILPRIFRTLAVWSFGIFLTAVLATAAMAQENIAIYPALPPGTSSIHVFDNQGRFVGRLLSSQRYWVGIDQIPLFLQQALVAIEDSRFYEHGGIDMRGVARALVKDVMKGRMAEGGSTITQQLIKNRYTHGEKTLERKVREGILAMEYEKKYTKRQILEMYFNEVYFGNGAWGIAQAARLYFDKTPQELSEIECILLAATPKAPGRYNPTGDPAKVTKRRRLILNRMLELSMISPRQEKALRTRPVTVVKASEAPSYLAHVRQKLVERYGHDVVERGGLDVITAMDLSLQRQAEVALKEGIRRVSKDLQGALIALDAQTGDVLAEVGGVDFAENPYDRAYFARRQPGSAMKPLIYAAAVEKGYTAGMVTNDAPISYSRGNGEMWTPLNYERRSFGEMSLRNALAHSNNVIAVKLLNAIGVPYFMDFAGRLGLALRSPGDLSLALGSSEVTLHDLVTAYAPLANGGLRPQSRTIVRVFDRVRKTWTESPAAVPTPVLNPGVAFVTTEMMKDVLTHGTAKSLKGFALKRPAAGKTGTTDDYRDAWFIGYTPQVITGVWAGHDKPRSGGAGFTGGAVCAPIWGRFMRTATAARPVVNFTKPENVLAVRIDPKTNELAVQDCPVTREEFYITGTQPTKSCARHGGEPAPESGPADSLTSAPAGGPAPAVPAASEPTGAEPARPEPAGPPR